MKHSAPYLLLVVGCVLVSTAFFTIVEHWKMMDSLYFSVVTLTTIGYGDHTPQTEIGKIFTIFYALSGITSFLLFINALSRDLFDESSKHRR